MLELVKHPLEKVLLDNKNQTSTGVTHRLQLSCIIHWLGELFRTPNLYVTPASKTFCVCVCVCVKFQFSSTGRTHPHPHMYLFIYSANKQSLEDKGVTLIQITRDFRR